MNGRGLLLAVLLGAQTAALWGCSAGSTGCGRSTDCTRVLFIGNSYTFVNDLPGTFSALASAGGHPVGTDTAAAGGWTLKQHADSRATLEKVRSEHWNIVVLQEQSQIPSSPELRQEEMYPAVRGLVEDIRGQGAAPLLFETWAHRGGWPEGGLPDYQSMQSAVDEGYSKIANEEKVAVSPVGYAWFTLLQEEPHANLWQEDGVHPNEEGTYLAACVFYAVIFQKSPVGVSYHGSLSDAEARKMQKVAAQTVLDEASLWGLDRLQES